MRDENKSNEEEQDEYRKAGFTRQNESFALRVTKLYVALPKRHEAQILGVKSSVRELLLEHIIEKLVGPSQTRISSVRLRAVYRN